MPREAYDSEIRTKDVPIIPHPHIDRIRWELKAMWQKMLAAKTPQPGRRLLLVEK